MKEALFYSKSGTSVHCQLCPWKCNIKDGALGVCKVRKNTGGKLVSLVYGMPCALHIDPVEKKPLFHFYPGESTLSIATFGCNLACGFCQNWEISKEFGGETGINKGQTLSPEDVVAVCIEKDAKIISFTYTEPTIFFEYMLDIAKLARKAGLKCVIVSNGYIEEEPLRMLCKHINAANIDLKGFNEDFYRESCKGTLAPVLRSLKILKEEGVWLEVTNLLIPGKNDDLRELDEMAGWIKENLGRGVPLHISRFHPDYNEKNIEATPLGSLKNASAIVSSHLDFVYVGNVPMDAKTFCPACKSCLVNRRGFEVIENKIASGRCIKCGFPVPGVWA